MDTERKLGEYFSPDISKQVFKECTNHFYGVSKVFPHSKGLQSVSKFQELLQIFWEIYLLEMETTIDSAMNNNYVQVQLYPDTLAKMEEWRIHGFQLY